MVRVAHPHRSWQRWRRHIRRASIQTVTAGPAAGLRIAGTFSSADYAAEANELPVQEAIASLLRPGDVFFDIGANVGFFSLIAARCVGSEGRVFAFEPVPDIAAQLVTNAGLNGFTNITVLPFAIADRDGSMNLQTTRHPGGATLEGFGTPGDRTGVITVTGRSLDSLVSEGAIPPPNVIKVDVEGAESAVLRGATALLSSAHPAVVYELDAATEGELQAKKMEVKARLDAASYELTQLPSSYGESHLVRHFVARYER